jgi:ubiquinone/menaquinone biosynthesis C-methylase UbiE
MKKTSIEFYTELGIHWLSDRKSVEQTKKELSYIMQFLKKNGKVLDLACGYGRLQFLWLRRDSAWKA